MPLRLRWKPLIKISSTVAGISVRQSNKAYIPMHIDIFVLRVGDVIREDSYEYYKTTKTHLKRIRDGDIWIEIRILF